MNDDTIEALWSCARVCDLKAFAEVLRHAVDGAVSNAIGRMQLDDLKESVRRLQTMARLL